jgi:hypothetical protein
MSADQIIGARVSSETKSQFRALASRQQISESALLKQLVDLTLRKVRPLDEQVLSPDRGLRGERVWVRLRPEDRLLLGERAANRGMAVATYVSALVRSHLRQLAPLPTPELDLMKRSVAELRAISRHLDQMVRAANGGARPAALNNGNAQVMLKVCEGLLDHVKALIKANLRSWDLGYADTKK